MDIGIAYQDYSHIDLPEKRAIGVPDSNPPPTTPAYAGVSMKLLAIKDSAGVNFVTSSGPPPVSLAPEKEALS